MKKCSKCGTQNPSDYKVCQNCGKLLQQTDGIKIGVKTVLTVILGIVLMLTWLGFRIYDRTAYQVIGLPDKKYNLDVVNFKVPYKWIPVGKVFYNPNSIPNLLTFFVAVINPKEDVECQFFSTQYETSNKSIEKKGGSFPKTDSVDYFYSIIKQHSTKAENIELIEIIEPSKDEIQQANKDKSFFVSMYENINPGTTKGQTWLDSMEVVPVHYLFSYQEDGKTYYHLLEGRFVFFIQCFSRVLHTRDDIHTAISYTKCENIFSYKAPIEYFKKNQRKYHTFKKSLKINPEWIEYSYGERRNLLSKMGYLTTESLVGGDKFRINEFKNMVYNIEYLDNTSVQEIQRKYANDFRAFLKKILE